MKKIIEYRVKKHGLHFVLWLLFILYETILIGLVSGIFGNPITYILHYSLIISLFYIHSDLILPRVFIIKRIAYWTLPLALVLEIAIFVSLSFILDQFLIAIHVLQSAVPLKLNYLYSLKAVYRCIYFLAFSSGYYFLVTYFKEKRKTNKLEKQRLEDIINRQKSEQELTKAKNAFLKAQIQPHFLFNTLDFIYHKIEEVSPVAAEAIIILSEMMRYAIDSDKMGDFICLEYEIVQVENLLFLNKIRKNDLINFQLIIEEEMRQINFIPLVLLTLVENIFKHGDLSRNEHEAIVRIYSDVTTFFIETDNIITQRKTRESSHIGLQNIRKRLINAYGKEVMFDFLTDQENHFKVAIAIPLKYLKVHDEPTVLLTNNDI